MDGTSLDDLDYSSAGTADRDIVKDILHIVNNGGEGGPGGRPSPPQLSSRNPQPMQNLPPPTGNTEMSTASDAVSCAIYVNGWRQRQRIIAH